MTEDRVLPIDAVLADVTASLRERANLVLVAPPGAGKTTRVPLALLDEPWAAGGKLILLEPRRLAARAAAARMATTLRGEVGGVVGLRVRLGSRIGPRTRIEVVTEGVFARMILDDPELTGVAAVLFDEFHERSLDADLGLALALDAQAGLRPDLRLIAMSATLDGARVASLMGDAPVLRSEGRAFPVETRYLGRDPTRRIEDEAVSAIIRALGEEEGSILVFLPGQGEIRRVAERLTERVARPDILIAPLYGAMDRDEQDRAIAAPPAGQRKVVLATSIAETSLTIEGVRVVIDSGLARIPRYEPEIGLTRLETVRVSRAAADQRRGRAGRTAPGICYRLWEQAGEGALSPFAEPEILAADLAPLLLDCAAWGVVDPSTLPFLDPPPRAALAEGRTLLLSLKALDKAGHITAFGRRLRALPLPPRLAAMVIQGATRGAGDLAADLAALLSERGLGGDGVDLVDRLERFRRDRSRRAEEMRGLARAWAKAAADPDLRPVETTPGRLVAAAFPERMAKARGRPGEFLMANGRACALDPADPLARSPFLAVAEIAGSATTTRLLAAAPLDETDLSDAAGAAIVEAEEIAFDRQSRSLRARHVRRYGALVLKEAPIPVPASPDAAAVLARGLMGLGVAALPFGKATLQWRDRVMFLRAAEGEASGWPDLSDEVLVREADTWLAPHLVGRSSLGSDGPDILHRALVASLPWDMARRLDAEAPTHVEMPTGSRVPVDYAAEDGPAIAVRVQELFGLTRHPTLAGGRVPLLLHLLSPAHRPIQITRDLPGFWRGSWGDVKKEMKARYPKHVWPDDPAAATPTTRAKPRGT